MHPSALLTLVTTFARSRLTDPGLGAPMIADHLDVTVAQLRELSGAVQFDLDQWILAERLDLARLALVSPTARTWSPDHGCQWGFSDTSRFADEFKSAYGVSPGEFQQIAAAEGPASAADDDGA